MGLLIHRNSFYYLITIMLIQVINKDGNRSHIETTVQPNWKNDYEDVNGVYFEKREQKPEQKPIVKKEVVAITEEKEIDIKELRKMYEAKFGKKLSPRFINDTIWIANKLAE